MVLEAQWIVGFVDGEGCFHIGINKNLTMTCKIQILPEFTVVQHKKNIQVLYALKEHFKCGVVRVNHGDRYAYRVRGLNNINTSVIPFFEKHQLKTKKNVDFIKFRKVVKIMMLEQNKHLTFEGIEEIKKVKETMNL